MVVGLFQALLLVTASNPFEAYNKTCPHISQRAFRSHDVCSDAPKNYSCLFDTNNENFTEYCSIQPDFSAPGEYYVYTGRRRNIECKKTTYQPYSLWSNESSRCTFKKSMCTQSGQVLYRMGSLVEDNQCRCDYTKRYAFVSTPTNLCFCIPSEEDCSCYIKQCGLGYILNADYKCTLQSKRNEERCDAKGIQTTTAEMKTQTGHSSDPSNVSKLEKSITPTMILVSVLLMLLLGLCLLAIVYNCENVKVKGALNQSVCSRTKLIDRDETFPDIDKTTGFEDFKDFKVVAAIDVGSSSSWYGSSTIYKFKTDPLNIKVDKNVLDGDTLFLPMKTATCILLKTDGSFISLGDKAQEEYRELLLDGNTDDYLFFDKFKMELYNNKNISDATLIKDVKGREMKAIDVFSSFIHELMEKVKRSYQELELDDIQWVLTVPAVWSEKAKSFMRRCAKKKGIREERILIALEPEAVSVYFQYLNKSQPTEIGELDRRYVVVDIGGGTVDLTAHEKTDSGDLIELCTSTGDDIGGRKVDKNFLDLFEEIVGFKVMKALTADGYTDSYFDILQEIEKIKRNILASKRIKLYFKIPFSNLDTLCKKHNNKSLIETIASSKHSKDISLKGDNMIFLRSSLLSLFQPVGNRISTKIRQVIEELKDLQINMILLAGGLSMSPVIVKIIEESFKSMKIIQLPQKYPADLAVVMGAVLYGHHPHFISSRITEYTYGRVVQPVFINGKHDPAKRTNVYGTDLCQDVFEILVLKNTKVNVNETIQREYEAMNTSQKEIRIAVYTTKKDKVDYVDDSECKLFCEVTVPLSESSSKKPCVIVDFVFGYTEFRVIAYDKKTKERNEVSVELK